jgi:hypothetical protein
MKLHVDEIHAEVDKVCVTQRGRPAEQMAEALAVGFLAVKMRDERFVAARSVEIVGEPQTLCHRALYPST